MSILDVSFELLYQSDMVTLRNLCLTAKQLYQTCNHYFWTLKFTQHKIPIIKHCLSINGLKNIIYYWRPKIKLI